MKTHSFRVIYYALIPVFVLALSGCAKKMVATSDADISENSVAGVIRDISVEGNDSAINITTTKPLTYTSYKTAAPPKIFIDLAQTEPGDFKPKSFETDLIKDIQVTRQSFGSGYLSRIEILLKKDLEFSVRQDPSDRNNLKVVLSSSTSADNSINAGPDTIKDDSAKPVVAETTSQVDQKEQIDVPVIPAGESTAANKDGVPQPEDSSQIATTQERPAAPNLKCLTGITVTDTGLEFAISGGTPAHTAFKLDKPARLVVDLFEVKNALHKNAIEINRFGFAKARIGTSPGKVRIVFDSTSENVPQYRLDQSDSRLTITFTKGSEDTANGNKSAGNSTIISKPPVETSMKVASSHGQIESIDFRMTEGVSRVEIKTNGICTAEKTTEIKRGILVTFAGCELPIKLQRSIDTKAFASAVLSVTPYQVKVAGINTSRILVKLRGTAKFTSKRDNDRYIIEVINPSSATPVVAVPLAKAEPSSVEEELLAQAKEHDPTDTTKSIITKQQPKKRYSGRRVTLEFSDADIRKIFQLIAEVSNLNFLLADDVTGTISIKLVNVPWDQALDVILDTKNLGMVREGNIAQIKPKSKMQSQADEELAAKKALERSMTLRTEIFDVNYASVSDIATQFGTLKSERGIISTDTRTNRVIVKDISTAIDDMRMLLKSLDTPEKQVMIEARIVEAKNTFVRNLGVQWGMHYTDGSASVAGISKIDTGFGGQVSPPPTSGASGPGAAVGMSFGKLSSNIQLDMRLSAAVTAEQIKVISTPRIVTLNNKPAKISQGDAIPYQTTSAEGTKTEFVEAALTLEVTPHITSDGSISMKIKAANNQPGTGSPPPISKKEATTELLVKNGETTVIGGIYTDRDTENDQGVPFLQDIPLLGWLFKSNSRNKEKNELLIFITPKIVS